MDSEKMNKVLLTGVTGFVGKVVLEELLRRREELKIDEIFVLIRKNRKGRDPEQRFDNEVASSPCFSKLGSHWRSMVRVIGGDLTLPYLGFNEANRVHLKENITHFINCAASIDFNLPVAEAALSNITTSLHALEFARSVTGLNRMVHVSTAYVAAHTGDNKPKEEVLAPLPRSAQDMYQDIVSGTVSEAELLEESGQPNTYTLTKCIAEHLMNAKQGNVPLVLVRPSIVSACWKYPFRGWIDSLAAFAGFVLMIGSGQMKTLVADKNNHLDVVPCDVVAQKILDSAFLIPVQNPGEIEIRHAVAGFKNNLSIQVCITAITKYFSNHPIFGKPGLKYVGPMNRTFRMKEWYLQRRPLALMRVWLGLIGQMKKKKAVWQAAKRLRMLNDSFPYFTTKEFDFKATSPFLDLEFRPENYAEVVCAGVYKHVLKKNESEQVFAGKKFRRVSTDLKWMIKQPQGNVVIRIVAYLARKAMRRAFDSVTFDRPSFERAVQFSDASTLKVIVPTHRSYADFVLCSYLFFDHPELGIAIPHIAAAEEFSKIPVLGFLFKKMNAFYIKRGVGKENPELTKQVHDLVNQKQTLEFFIEGTRSRSRQILTPRRGMLKCLQGTGQKCTVLPISISYDRVPEEDAFVKELRGRGKPKMTLRSAVAWYFRLLRGKVKLGRIHIACGQPLELSKETNVAEFSLKVNAELERQLVVSTHHLEAFLKEHPHASFDSSWLKEMIQKRGGNVMESRLKVPDDLNPVIEQTMRYHWRHFFFGDSLAMHTDNAALSKHVAKNSYTKVAAVIAAHDWADDRFRELMELLFKPICNDYLATLEELKPGQSIPLPEELLQKIAQAHLPNVQEAYEDMVARQILAPRVGYAGFEWGSKSGDFENLKTLYCWPEKQRLLAAVS